MEALRTWIGLSPYGLYWGCEDGDLIVGIHGLFLLDWFTDPENNLSALGSRERMHKSGLHACGELSGGRRREGSHPSFDWWSLNLLYSVWCLTLPSVPHVAEYGISLIHFPQRINILLLKWQRVGRTGRGLVCLCI